MGLGRTCEDMLIGGELHEISTITSEQHPTMTWEHNHKTPNCLLRVVHPLDPILHLESPKGGAWICSLCQPGQSRYVFSACVPYCIEHLSHHNMSLVFSLMAGGIRSFNKYFLLTSNRIHIHIDPVKSQVMGIGISCTRTIPVVANNFKDIKGIPFGIRSSPDSE